LKAPAWLTPIVAADFDDRISRTGAAGLRGSMSSSLNRRWESFMTVRPEIDDVTFSGGWISQDPPAG
jgi:hypothetical protein